MTGLKGGAWGYRGVQGGAGGFTEVVSESSYSMLPEKMVSRQCLACAGDAGSLQGFLSLLESNAIPCHKSAGSSDGGGCYHGARPLLYASTWARWLQDEPSFNPDSADESVRDAGLDPDPCPYVW